MSPENITHGWGERAVAFLRRRHPYGAARHIAQDLGVSVRTAEKWLDGSTTMNADALMRGFAVYGPPFLSAVFPGLAWVEALAVTAEAEVIETRAARVLARSAEARALLQGRP